MAEKLNFPTKICGEEPLGAFVTVLDRDGHFIDNVVSADLADSSAEVFTGVRHEGKLIHERRHFPGMTFAIRADAPDWVKEWLAEDPETRGTLEWGEA